MDRKRLLEVISVLTEVHKVKETPRGFDTTCPLAEWKHEKGYDRSPGAFFTLENHPEGFFYCNSCAFGGDLFTLVSTLNFHTKGKYSALERALVMEENSAIVERGRTVVENEGPTRPTPLESLDPEEVYDESELDRFAGQVPEYAVQRVTLASCKAWELGYDVAGRRWTFPLRRWPDKGLVGLTGRTILDKEQIEANELQTGVRIPKYYNYWNFDRGRFLFGEHRVDPTHKRLILVEGPVDVVRGYEHGHQNVLAVMGSRLTDDQGRKVKLWDLPIIVMADPDGKLMRSARRELTDRFLRIAQMPQGKDPADLTSEEFYEAIDQSRSMYAKA